MIELELEVSHLKEIVRALQSVVDQEDIVAARELRHMTPSNAQLRLWAQSSTPPDELADKSEERPW